MNGILNWFYAVLASLVIVIVIGGGAAGGRLPHYPPPDDYELALMYEACSGETYAIDSVFQAEFSKDSRGTFAINAGRIEYWLYGFANNKRLVVRCSFWYRDTFDGWRWDIVSAKLL